MGWSTITFNGQTITATRVITRLQQATLKQTVGRTLVENPIVGSALQDQVLSIEFTFQGSVATLDTARSTLIASNDATKHAYTDGIRTINCVMVPESLEFNEQGGSESVLSGRFVLKEFQQ